MPLPSEVTPTFKRDGIYIAVGTLAILCLALLSDVLGFRWLRWMFLIMPSSAFFMGLLSQTPTNGSWRRSNLFHRRMIFGNFRTGRHDASLFAIR